MNILLRLLGGTTVAGTRLDTKSARQMNIVSGNDPDQKTAFLKAVDVAARDNQIRSYIAIDIGKTDIDTVALSNNWDYIEAHEAMLKPALQLIQKIDPRVEYLFTSKHDCELYVRLKEATYRLSDMGDSFCHLLEVITAPCIVSGGVTLIGDIDHVIPEHALIDYWNFTYKMAELNFGQVFVGTSSSEKAITYLHMMRAYHDYTGNDYSIALVSDCGLCIWNKYRENRRFNLS